MDDLSLDGTVGSVHFSDYVPITVNVSNPSDSGDYTVIVETSNTKIMEIIEAFDVKNTIKITVNQYMQKPEDFFGHLELQDTTEIDADLKRYQIDVTRIK